MLQDLLTQRFPVRLHREVRPFPGYELTVAAGGPRIKEVTPAGDPPDRDTIVAAMQNTPIAKDDKGFPALTADMQFRFIKPRIGTWGTIRSRFRERMSEFVEILPTMIIESSGDLPGSSPVPRVSDRTGLTGFYEFTLEYDGGALLPSNSPLGAALAERSKGENLTIPADDPPGGSGRSLFNALDKQLGLTLKKIKDVPVDVLVVDFAEKIPTEN